jgi:hypothetical protein
MDHGGIQPTAWPLASSADLHLDSTTSPPLSHRPFSRTILSIVQASPCIDAAIRTESNRAAATRVQTCLSSKSRLPRYTISAPSVGSPLNVPASRPSARASNRCTTVPRADIREPRCYRPGRGRSLGLDLTVGTVAAPGQLELLLSRGVDFSHGHLVDRQCAGLVRTDRRCAAKSFDGGQLADDGAPPRHPRDTDGNVIVTTAGNPSGIALTASATAAMNMSKAGCPASRRRRNVSAANARITTSSRRLNRRSCESAAFPERPPLTPAC